MTDDQGEVGPNEYKSPDGRIWVRDSDGNHRQKAGDEQRWKSSEAAKRHAARRGEK